MNNKLNRLYRRVIRQFRVKELTGFCHVQLNNDASGYTVKFNTPSINENPLLIGGGGSSASGGSGSSASGGSGSSTPGGSCQKERGHCG